MEDDKRKQIAPAIPDGWELMDGSAQAPTAPVPGVPEGWEVIGQEKKRGGVGRYLAEGVVGAGRNIAGVVEGVGRTGLGLVGFPAAIATTLGAKTFGGKSWEEAEQAGGRVAEAIQGPPNTPEAAYYQRVFGSPFEALGLAQHAAVGKVAPDEPETQAMLNTAAGAAMLVGGPRAHAVLKAKLARAKTGAERMAIVKEALAEAPKPEAPVKPSPVKPTAKPPQVPEVEYVAPEGPAPHAAEGGWSPEALSRGKSTAMFIYDTATKKTTPIIGPDAVDVAPGPGKIKLQLDRRTGQLTPIEYGKGAEGARIPMRMSAPAPVAAAAAKEPWQMTRGEFGIPDRPADVEVPRYPQLERLIREGKPITEADRAVLAKQAQAKQSHTKYLGWHRKHLGKANEHFLAVQAALAEGKSIPESVLAEYPSLAAKARPLADIEAAMPPASGTPTGIVAPGFEGKMPPPPEVQRVASVIADQPTFLQRVGTGAKRVAEKPGQAAAKVAQAGAKNFIDRYDPVRVWEKRLQRESGKSIPIDQSAYWNLRARGGAGGVAQESYFRLQDILKPVGEYGEQFTNYLLSMRMMERDLNGITNPGGIRVPEAMASYQKIMGNLDPQTKVTFKKTAQQFYDWADKEILQTFVDSKMLSRRDYQRIKAKNRHWLPFEKIEDMKALADEVNFSRFKDGENFTNVVHNELYSQRGMTERSRIKDPWEAVIERMGAARAVAERNTALFNLVRNSQMTPGGRSHVRRLKGTTDPPPGHGSFGVVINGTVQKWSAPAELLEVIKTLEKKDLDVVQNIMGKTKGAFVAGTTGLNLPFSLVTNPLRDAAMAAFTSKYGFSPVSYLNGLVHSLASAFGFPTKLYRQYLSAHAAYGQMINRVPRMAAKELFRSPLSSMRPLAAFGEKVPMAATRVAETAARVVNPISLATGLGKAWEMAPRLAVFQKSLRGVKRSAEFAGETPAQQSLRAGMLSRTSTIDFHRAGHFVKAMNYYVPFINARVQAVVNSADAFFNKGGIRAGKSTFMGVRGDPRWIAAARATALVTMPTLAAYFYSRLHHDDLYQRIPEDYRDRYVVIPIGESEDPDTGAMKVDAITIPKGDVAQLIGNPLTALLDWAWKKEPLDMKKVALQFFSDISPIPFEKEGKPSLPRALGSALPPVLQAPITVATNRKLYWDRPVVPQALERVDPGEQYTSYTPKTYRKLGQALGLSPLKIEAFAGAMFGGVTRMTSPKRVGEEIGGRAVRQIGQAVAVDLAEADKEASRGYFTARLRAERLLKEGKRGDAIRLLQEWNRQMPAMAERMAKTTGEQAGKMRASGWYKRYTFQPEDIKRLVRGVAEPYTPALQKQLGIDGRLR